MIRMKWPVVLMLAAAIAALFLPAVSLHVHSQLGEETAALFPENLSLAQIIFRGTDSLPAEQFPAFRQLSMACLPLGLGMLLLVLAGICSLVGRKGCHQLALAAACMAAALLGTGLLQWMNLSGSLLFSMLFTLQFGLYLSLIAAAAMILYLFVTLKGQEPACRNDRFLRKASAAAALLALLSLLLPAYSIHPSASLTADPADASALSRSTSLVTVIAGPEKGLYDLRQETGALSSPVSGDLETLSSFSSDPNNVGGIFQIRSAGGSLNAALIAAAAMLLAGLVLSLIPRVDRWFPLVLFSLAALLIAMDVLGILSVGSGDMYSSVSRQVLYLGLGSVTVFPLITVLLAFSAALCAVLGVRYANEPYFVNPMPAGFRIRFVAAALAALALVCVLLPGATVSYTKPGKNKVQATATVSGLQAVTFSAAKELADPVDSKGKAVYAESDEEYSAGAVNAATEKLASRFTWLTWGSLVLILAALVLLLAEKNRKLVIALFLAALALRLVTWFTLGSGLPRAVATVSGTLYLYASLPLLVFAAFFTNFAHLEELPKKYKLFLMMLPFLLAVFLFSYLPLYGWSYAFYNYKFGVPMDQQEFVGLKWFTEMFTNPANRENIARVLTNTLGMSGLNLATSWLPMIFAVFLNEITRTRFKKFVQIFTTLPNFISWALVFSFAMCLFAADTGIYSKLMIELGLNDPMNPTVWLNSSEHIWLKMWGWSTWKGLGWGAIMYLAAIAGIDQELYEAARVDGANRWALMRHITLPSLMPTFFVLFMLAISNILNNGMEQYLVFQNPMNRATMEVLDLYVYNITIASGGTALYSYATAIGILKTLVSVTLLFTANFLSKKLRGESIM